jgi:alcohol dehydrogenase class IV
MVVELQEKARRLISGWRGDTYGFGTGVLSSAGPRAARLGRKALLVSNSSPWSRPHLDAVVRALKAAGVELAGGICPGAAPNGPREDVYRIETYILHRRPDAVIAFGGGSTIDAAKAATALAALGAHDPEVEPYFGTGEVSRALASTGARMLPMLAIQTAASSAAHLTRYSNVTDPVSAQKKLIVDDALIPSQAVFDYSLTWSAPADLTLDGAFDGMAHCLEVYWGIPADSLPLVSEIALTALELIVKYLPAAVAGGAPAGLHGGSIRTRPGAAPCCASEGLEAESREALGLATDLGGYAIMVGGTNGPHLNSFSLVDVASHGRACAILNPYYTVFFAPAIEDRVRAVGEVLARYGHGRGDLSGLRGLQLGRAVAEGMIDLSKSLGYPTTLGELPGFGREHIDRALAAAKNPQLASKLGNMPVPLRPEDVDCCLGPVLRAAAAGDLSMVKSRDRDCHGKGED